MSDIRVGVARQRPSRPAPGASPRQPERPAVRSSQGREGGAAQSREAAKGSLGPWIGRPAASPAGPHARPGAARARGVGPGGRGGGAQGDGLGPLTGLGVSLVLVAACALGGLLDLFLVGGPAWAVSVLYIAACGYTAGRVRSADWFTALVAPPIAFAASMIMLAELMPNAFGHGLLGVAATTFELLAGKAKALYAGAALSATVLVARRVRRRTAA